MKKLIFAVLLMLPMLFVAAEMHPAEAAKPDSCTTIQSGELLDSVNNPIEIGYDMWGYNYQAHMYNGEYCDYARTNVPCAYEGTNLSMKWNDAWLSNNSCDADMKLDRHYDLPSYIGSGAWLTNHMSGEYEMEGEMCYWDYFVKIEAAPVDAYVNAGMYYTEDDVEIGPAIWGEFVITQEVENDACAGVEGKQLLSPGFVGLGN